MADLVERLRAMAGSDMVPMEKTMKLLLEAASALEAEWEDAERYRALRGALLYDGSEAWEAFIQQPEPKNAADFDAAIDGAREEGNSG